MVLLVALTIFAYAPVRQLDFITLDDPVYVSQNPLVLGGLKWSSLKWAMTTNHDSNWFPLTWISLMIDAQFYGAHAGGYHLTNLLLHLGNTLLVFAVLYLISGGLGPSALTAGLFGLHPLHVESVAWVTERKDVLSGFFFLLALGAYAAYVRRPGVARYTAVILLFALGLMSKPMLVTFPFVLLLLDFWPLRRVGPVGSESFWKVLAEKIPFFALTMVSSIVTFIVQRQGGTVSDLQVIPFELRLENSVIAYVAYIWKMVWPARLAILYPFSRSLPAGSVIGSILLLGGISLVAVLLRRRHPYLIVGWLWYLGMLVPVIGLVQVGYQAMADRYSYLPLIGLFIIVSWGVAELLAGWSYGAIAFGAVAVILALGCAATARAQVGYWSNSLTLWQHALDVTTDNSHAHNNLGMALAQRGRGEEAIAQYEEALRIDPQDSEAHNNLGNALFRRGSYGEAGQHYSEAVRIRPNMAEAHNGFGAALAAQGRLEEASQQYGEALRLNPNDADFHTNRGLVLQRMGNYSAAIEEFSEAIRLLPSSAEAHYGMGLALVSGGKPDEAREQFHAALEINPQFGDAQKELDNLNRDLAAGANRR